MTAGIDIWFYSFGGCPTVDGVGGDIAEEQIVVRMPYWSFGELESSSDEFGDLIWD